MKARIAITIIALCIYVGLFNLYIFEFLKWSPYADRLFYNLLTLWAFSFALIDLKTGFVNNYHKQLNLVLFLCIITNYILIVFKLLECINPQRPQPMFYTFNGSVFVITVTIFFNELKYKILE